MLRHPLTWAVMAAVAALAVFVFVTEAPAYAGTASETCANCHVMDSMYENYFHAPHRPWAECADCHLPHENAVTYYMEKGRQGMHDVYVFSTGPDARADPPERELQGDRPGRTASAATPRRWRPS